MTLLDKIRRERWGDRADGAVSFETWPKCVLVAIEIRGGGHASQWRWFNVLSH